MTQQVTTHCTEYKNVLYISASFAYHTCDQTCWEKKKVPKNSDWWKNCIFRRKEIFYEDAS